MFVRYTMERCFTKVEKNREYTLYILISIVDTLIQ
jgi:hypothetical protein